MRYILAFGLIALIGAGAIVVAQHDGWQTSYQGVQNIVQSIRPTTVLFVGDIMLGRHVEVLMKEHGSEYPFEGVSGFLGDHHMVVANLEGPIPAQHLPTPSGKMNFNFDASIVPLLAKHNIKIVSLANNHTYDGGRAGYDQTATSLADGGVKPFGHPFSTGNAYVLRKIIHGKNFTFIGFNATNPNFDAEAALELIRQERKVDEFLVVASHAGEEYKLISNDFQKVFYRACIEAGADVVIGHHPHVVQEVELYKNKIIFYSLGNFIFDQYFSKDVERGLTVKLSLTDSKVSYELIPIKGNKSQPQKMGGAERTEFLKNLANRSSVSLQEQILDGKIEIE